MAYQPNIPQPADIFPNSQGDILRNFQALNTQFSVEHDNLNVLADGKHKYATMQRGTVLPALAGQDAQVSQQVTAAPNSAPYLQYRDTTGTYAVMLSRTVSPIAVVVGSNNIFNFAGMSPCAGLVIVFENAPGNPQRTVFTQFAYVGGNLWCPGIGPAGYSPTTTGGQLISGSELKRFTAAGINSILILDSTVNASITLKIIYSAI
jgi:hypothetical protein